MADQVSQSSAEQPVAGSKRKNVVMIGALVGVMVIEALAVFFAVKHFSKSANPNDAHAEGTGLLADEGKKHVPELEVRIGEFRAQNRKGQQSYTVSFAVYATVPVPEKKKDEGKEGKKEEGGEGEEKTTGPKLSSEDALVASKAAKIRDRFTRVIRSVEPEAFAEPDLTTLRGKLKEELSGVLGPEIKVQEVLLTDFSCSADS